MSEIPASLYNQWRQAFAAAPWAPLPTGGGPRQSDKSIRAVIEAISRLPGCRTLEARK